MTTHDQYLIIAIVIVFVIFGGLLIALLPGVDSFTNTHKEIAERNARERQFNAANGNGRYFE